MSLRAREDRGVTTLSFESDSNSLDAVACSRRSVSAVDVDVLGEIHPRPRHPTLEVRAFPMSMDADVVLSRVEQAERFFAEIARTADASHT
jgi:hypothetical protein